MLSEELKIALLELDKVARDNFSLLRYCELIEHLTRPIQDEKSAKRQRTLSTRKLLDVLMQDEKNAMRILEIIRNLREKYHLPSQSEYEQESAALDTYNKFWGEIDQPIVQAETIHTMPIGV